VALPELRIALNRIDGRVALNALRGAELRAVEEHSFVELPLSDRHIIELHFPVAKDAVDRGWFEVAEDVFIHLVEMDNAEQYLSAAQCERSGIDPINYESELLDVRLLDAENVVLHYQATVNAEWDEQFRRVDGKWVLLPPPEETGDG
jgi:hypothetical protein